MSIDITLQTPRKERFSESLSDNLMEMATQAKLYAPIWTPCHHCAINGLDNLTPRAEQLIKGLEYGIAMLRNNTELFRNEGGLHDAIEIWNFAERYLIACRKWPDALVVVT